jgi:predicted porin
MPMKKSAGAARIVSDTGIWGVGRMLYGDSSTFNGQATPYAFSRRQNSSLFYDSPNFSGFQVSAGISSTSTSIGQTANSSGSKPRVWGVGGSYTNGPLYVTLAYESHKNFGANNNINGGLGYNGDDHAYHAGIAYQFGPVKVGLMYVKRNYDMSANGSTDLDVDTWNLAGEWNIAGPHSLRGGYTKANDTGGSAGGTTALNPPITFGAAGGNLVANGGAGSTGGWIGQVQYVYNASKRTEYTVGYVYLSNDSNARYSLGGLSAGTIKPGETQQAFAVSMKTTF